MCIRWIVSLHRRAWRCLALLFSRTSWLQPTQPTVSALTMHTHDREHCWQRRSSLPSSLIPHQYTGPRTALQREYVLSPIYGHLHPGFSSDLQYQHELPPRDCVPVDTHNRYFNRGLTGTPSPSPSLPCDSVPLLPMFLYYSNLSTTHPSLTQSPNSYFYYLSGSLANPDNNRCWWLWMRCYWRMSLWEEDRRECVGPYHAAALCCGNTVDNCTPDVEASACAAGGTRVACHSSLERQNPILRWGKEEWREGEYPEGVVWGVGSMFQSKIIRATTGKYSLLCHVNKCLCCD